MRRTRRSFSSTRRRPETTKAHGLPPLPLPLPHCPPLAPWRRLQPSWPRGNGSCLVGFVLVFGFSANSVVAARGGHTLLGKVRFVLLLAPLPLLFLFFYIYILCCAASIRVRTNQVSIAPDIQNKIIVASDFFPCSCSCTRVSIVVVVGFAACTRTTNLQHLLKSCVFR